MWCFLFTLTELLHEVTQNKMVALIFWIFIFVRAARLICVLNIKRENKCEKGFANFILGQVM